MTDQPKQELELRLAVHIGKTKTGKFLYYIQQPDKPDFRSALFETYGRAIQSLTKTIK